MDADEFQRRFSEAADEAVAWNNDFAAGVKSLLTGRTVVDATAEVWDSDGNWAITIWFDDGSVVEVPGQAWAAGPLAALVKMAGGDPHEDEVG